MQFLYQTAHGRETRVRDGEDDSNINDKGGCEVLSLDKKQLIRFSRWASYWLLFMRESGYNVLPWGSREIDWVVGR